MGVSINVKGSPHRNRCAFLQCSCSVKSPPPSPFLPAPRSLGYTGPGYCHSCGWGPWQPGTRTCLQACPRPWSPPQLLTRSCPAPVSPSPHTKFPPGTEEIFVPISRHHYNHSASLRGLALQVREELLRVLSLPDMRNSTCNNKTQH